MNKINKQKLEENSEITVSLSNDQNLLRENDYNVLIDAHERYIRERNESNIFRIMGKVKMVFRNQYLGVTSFPPLLPNFYLNNDGTGDTQGYLPYNEFAFIRDDAFRMKNQTPEGNDIKNYDLNMVPINPPTHRLITLENVPYFNWGFHLSYVSGIDEERPIGYTLSDGEYFESPVNEGIVFRVQETSDSFILTSPIKHNMKVGEYIVISLQNNVFKKIVNDTIVDSFELEDRVFLIESVGNNTYDSENFVITLSKYDMVEGVRLEKVVFGKRCLDKNNLDTISEYYCRKHTMITDERDYSFEKLGFETNIWENEKKILFENILGDNDVLVERNRMETNLLNFTEPFILGDIKDNFGRNPKEIYITSYFKNGNGYFEYPPKVGYKFNFHDGWIDGYFEGDRSFETGITIERLPSIIDGEFYGGQVRSGDELMGDIVEYNKYELKETVMSVAYHKITSRKDIFNHNQDRPSVDFSGVNSENMYGYFYQVHQPITLYHESDVVSISNDKDIKNLPENSLFFENEGVWRWRELYDHSYVDENGVGTKYPFLNGVHYVKKDFNFYLRSETYYRNKKDGIKKFNKKKDDFC